MRSGLSPPETPRCSPWSARSRGPCRPVPTEDLIHRQAPRTADLGGGPHPAWRPAAFPEPLEVGQNDSFSSAHGRDSLGARYPRSPRPAGLRGGPRGPQEVLARERGRPGPHSGSRRPLCSRLCRLGDLTAGGPGARAWRPRAGTLAPVRRAGLRPAAERAGRRGPAPDGPPPASRPREGAPGDQLFCLR